MCNHPYIWSPKNKVNQMWQKDIRKQGTTYGNIVDITLLYWLLIMIVRNPLLIGCTDLRVKEKWSSLCTVYGSILEEAGQWGTGHMGPRAFAKAHIWVLGPTTAGVCVDYHGPCCHWEPFRCLCWTMLLPVKAILKSVAWAATIDYGHVCTGWCWEPYLGPSDYLRQHLWWCS